MKILPITLAAVTFGLAAAIVAPNIVQAAPARSRQKHPAGGCRRWQTPSASPTPRRRR